ncbi:MAG TPA: peptidase, partial [Verrucomicrobiae bacterium]|nr:peptidase [Verrucomicrobiae bacterium]
PEEKLAVAYTTNAKVYPVKDIVSGVIDIYHNKPFQIPAFESIEVSPEVLEKYVGVYSSPDVPAKFTITREGATLFVQPGNQGAAPLEATAEDKFQLLGGRVTFEFDAAKKQMIQKRGGPARVFTKEK